MSKRAASRTAAGVELGPALAAAMVAELPAVARHVVAAVIDEVPDYRDTLSDRMRATIQQAVQVALAGFVELVAAGRAVDPGTPLAPVADASYDLGRGEARSGRSMDALQAAYRVGGRVSWRDLAAVAVRHDLSAEQTALLAELVFAYIDELSAASVTGHADELATSGRVRERLLEQLARALLGGAAPDAVSAAAARAEWTLPASLTVLLAPDAQVRRLVRLLDPRTLVTASGVPDLGDDDLVALVVPDANRAMLLQRIAQRPVVVGPTRPWSEAAVSFRRARQAHRLLSAGRAEGAGPLDTDAHLPELVLRGDEELLADLRRRALAPLDALRPGAREKLTETLRSWLLHHGRRDGIAAELFVHPQTVRYRMGQLRELYGERLEDPATVLELTVALGARPPHQ